jgi:SAM-dependent methyltransferase
MDNFNRTAKRLAKRIPGLRPLGRRVRSAYRRFRIGMVTVPGLPGRIHYNDLSYVPGHEEQYAYCGQDAVACLERSLQSAGRDLDRVERFLDMPCGYGRVLRYIGRRWPNAQVDACELNAQALRFCAAEFGARPIRSNTRFDRLAFPASYDLIWVGSLFTHLDRSPFAELMAVLSRALDPGGVLVLTTHGDFSLTILDEYGADVDPRAAESEYRDRGFSFALYPGGDPAYGLSLASSEFVRNCAAEAGQGRLELTWFGPRGWAEHQDVHAFRARK